jgi:hypothetical protein
MRQQYIGSVALTLSSYALGAAKNAVKSTAPALLGTMTDRDRRVAAEAVTFQGQCFSGYIGSTGNQRGFGVFVREIEP